MNAPDHTYARAGHNVGRMSVSQIMYGLSESYEEVGWVFCSGQSTFTVDSEQE